MTTYQGGYIMNSGENEIVVEINAVWRRRTNRIISRICWALNNYKTPRDQIYRTLEEKSGCSLSKELEKLRKRAVKQRMSCGQVNKLGLLDVIANNEMLKKIYISSVEEMAVKKHVRF